MSVEALPATHAQRLEAIASRLDEYRLRFDRAHDSRAVFTYAYAVMTRRISAELPSAGLADPEWIVALAERFSRRYFEALDAYDADALGSDAWRAVFDGIVGRRTSVLEDLVLAITAHIVHDLPLALRDTGLTAADGRSHIRDFHAVNDMMASTVDTIQNDVARRYSPVIRWLDHVGEGYDEILTNYGARMARGLAWYNAERLLDPASAADAAAAIEHSPQLVVAEVLKPPKWSLRILLRFARWLTGFFRRWPAAPPA